MASILKGGCGLEALRTREQEPDHEGSRKVPSRFRESMSSSCAGTKGRDNEGKKEDNVGKIS